MPVRIVSARYGGNFVTETGGELPFLLPGELVDTGAATDILEPSPVRVAPLCSHFGSCGGCQYQHSAYAAQVEMKAGILRGIFGQAGLTGLPDIRTHCGAPWGYRNRIRLRVEATSPNSFQAGYSRRASNEFLPITECPIAAPLLWKAAAALLRCAPARLLASVAEVELFCNGDLSRLQLQFFLRAPLADATSFTNLCERLRRDVPELAGVAAELAPELNRSARRRWNGFAWGAPGLNYEAAGRAYWVSRGAFFQVNRFLVDRLVALVCEDAAGHLAWDLFAGVGLFTRALAERFDRVVAVEAGDAAAKDLAIAGRGGKSGPPFEAFHASTLDFLRARETQRERPELIVLDPPRAGLGAEAAAVLARIAAPRLVYVSCDPTTLARDLAILTRETYRIDALDLVDLFPRPFTLKQWST